ncbi:MAG: lysophospholipid acyltransferase family protein [Acidobacteria bacterium]|nr:lysophospholipid acyltransferase family protein [Acidobacteriota bacterium]MBP7474658.1 lysophospholipid acyltransferase family protein [Pyrinomonadaceae bacterium]MBP9109294.1 lysophospholipid acyltransferase family protein [Pyrinomonadaceae bacterium]
MPDEKDIVYKFTSLSEYPPKTRLMIRLADIVFFSAIWLVGKLTSFEIEGREHLDAIRQNGKIPILTFWHDRIFLSTYYFRDYGIVVISSRSFDGEYTSRLIKRFGYGSIRGSSSRGGSGALVEMIKAMRRGLPTGFTLDGPRGPKYVAKPGAVLLAKKTGNPLLPFIIESRSYWTAKSWDQMQIPKPFSKAKVFIGEPIEVAPDDDMDAKLAELQSSLDNIVERGRVWRAG